MLFRNTSAPTNPFSTETSLISSVYNKGSMRAREGYSPIRSSNSRSKLGGIDNSYWSKPYKQETNINDIKQDNPFDRCKNLQDLVREGLSQKHEHERSRRYSPSPYKPGYTSGDYYKPESSKYLDTPSGNGYSNGYSQYRSPPSQSYIPNSYTSKTYQYNSSNYNSIGNPYDSSSYIPLPSSYTPLMPEEPYKPIQLNSSLQKKPASKFKPMVMINGTQESSHYSFDNYKRGSNVDSISEYFPAPKQTNMFEPMNPVEPQSPTLQKKDSIMSRASQKQSIMKNSLAGKPSIRSSNLRFSSAEQRDTFGPPGRLQNKGSISDDPFSELRPGNANFAYQSFVEQKNIYPEFIQLSNQKFYYKPLKPKPKMR